METEKGTKSILNILILVSIILCSTLIIGLYTKSQQKKIRDTIRMENAQQIRTAIELYKLEFDQLPDNQTQNEWDVSYETIDARKTLFRNLIEKFFLSDVSDPLNNQNFHYRYHKFQEGEYGCKKSFAIFQIVSFERKFDNTGFGVCPHRDFTKEAPNGYTIQWFE